MYHFKGNYDCDCKNHHMTSYFTTVRFPPCKDAIICIDEMSICANKYDCGGINSNCRSMMQVYITWNNWTFQPDLFCNMPSTSFSSRKFGQSVHSLKIN